MKKSVALRGWVSLLAIGMALALAGCGSSRSSKGKIETDVAVEKFTDKKENASLDIELGVNSNGELDYTTGVVKLELPASLITNKGNTRDGKVTFTGEIYKNEKPGSIQYSSLLVGHDGTAKNHEVSMGCRDEKCEDVIAIVYQAGSEKSTIYQFVRREINHSSGALYKPGKFKRVVENVIQEESQISLAEAVEKLDALDGAEESK